MSTKRLLIVQPYIPAYRAPLFSALNDRLSDLGIEFLVAHGSPHGMQAARQDAVHGQPWSVALDQRVVRIPGGSIQRRSVSAVLSAFQPTHVVIEQALHNLESYEIGAWALRTRVPVAMWGQGNSYSIRGSQPKEALKLWLTKKASWFFAYTEGGRDHLVSKGFPSGRVTVLRNSTDTDALKADLESLNPKTLAVFQEEQGLDASCSALFLGGLDVRKGLPFLLAAAERVRASLPGFLLMIAGEGVLAQDLAHRQAQGAPIRVLGRVEGAERARALASATVLAIPEWVGLVAVDSLAAGVPIVTTLHPRHAPEFEYLADGVNSIVTDHTIAAYASGICDVLRDPQTRGQLSQRCKEDSVGLSIADMADRFATGIVGWFGS